MKNTPIIALDFDGTLVTHEYPDIGQNIGAEFWLKNAQESYECKYILNTMRSGNELVAAVNWCERVGIELWAVNQNPEQKRWTQSPKVYAHLYIDDAVLGIPLIHPNNGGRAYVNWQLVGPMFFEWLINN